MCFATSVLCPSVHFWWCSDLQKEWFSTSWDSPHWLGLFCYPWVLVSLKLLLVAGSIYLFHQIRQQIPLWQEWWHWTNQSFGMAMPYTLDSYILFLQGDCPKWLRLEFITVLSLLSNNYFIFDRYWFKLAFTTAFHQIKRLWRSF